MILLILLGTALYFILPLYFIMYLLEKNNFMIFKWDADVYLVGWVTLLIELGLFIFILDWLKFI